MGEGVVRWRVSGSSLELELANAHDPVLGSLTG